MSDTEAREAAWREIYLHGADYDEQDCLEADVVALLNIEREEDEQRIAALVAALEQVRNELWRYLGGRSLRAAAINRAFSAADEALRALAGQTEANGG